MDNNDDSSGSPREIEVAPTMQSICADFLAAGFREYPDQFKKEARFFAKRFDAPTRCHLNDDKEGQQICVWIWEFSGRPSIEMELCAGLSDGTWVKLQNYGLPKNATEVIALIPRLIAAWETIANRPTA